MRQAVDGAAEQFVVRTVADAEVGGAGPLLPVGGVRGGEGGDGARGAVGDEVGVGGDVGDELVQGRGVVGQDAGGGEGLQGRERVGDEGSGWSRGGLGVCGGRAWFREGGCWVRVEGGRGAEEQESARCFHAGGVACGCREGGGSQRLERSVCME